jgi:hypothetical protein
MTKTASTQAAKPEKPSIDEYWQSCLDAGMLAGDPGELGTLIIVPLGLGNYPPALPPQQPQGKTPRDLITFDEAALILGIDTGALERLCTRGELKTYERTGWAERSQRQRLLHRDEVLELASDWGE